MTTKSPIVVSDDGKQHEEMQAGDTLPVENLPIEADPTNILEQGPTGLYAQVTGGGSATATVTGAGSIDDPLTVDVVTRVPAAGESNKLKATAQGLQVDATLWNPTETLSNLTVATPTATVAPRWNPDYTGETIRLIGHTTAYTINLATIPVSVSSKDYYRIRVIMERGLNPASTVRVATSGTSLVLTPFGRVMNAGIFLYPSPQEGHTAVFDLIYKGTLSSGAVWAIEEVVKSRADTSAYGEARVISANAADLTTTLNMAGRPFWMSSSLWAYDASVFFEPTATGSRDLRISVGTKLVYSGAVTLTAGIPLTIRLPLLTVAATNITSTCDLPNISVTMLAGGTGNTDMKVNLHARPVESGSVLADAV
jgi:hypothetical protein